jgi:hypothetical protein
MPPSHYLMSFRATFTAAVLVMAVIIGWRISSPAADLIRAYGVHVTLTTPHPSPHPSRSSSTPACTYVPKIVQFSR